MRWAILGLLVAVGGTLLLIRDRSRGYVPWRWVLRWAGVGAACAFLFLPGRCAHYERTGRMLDLRAATDPRTGEPMPGLGIVPQLRCVATDYRLEARGTVVAALLLCGIWAELWARLAVPDPNDPLFARIPPPDENPDVPWELGDDAYRHRPDEGP